MHHTYILYEKSDGKINTHLLETYALSKLSLISLIIFRLRVFFFSHLYKPSIS